MASYAAVLKPVIRTILESSDLSSISAKGVRKNLIARGQDEASIKANRAEIDEIISGIYDELTADADDGDNASESSEEKPLLSTHTPSGSQSQSAPPPSSLPRPLSKPKVKRESKPTKAEITDSEGDGEQDDEAYARQLQSEFNALTGSARASRASAPGSSTRPKAKKVVKKKKRSAATVDSGDEEGPKKKRAAPNTAFNKDLILSDSLSALVGETRLSRPQTVKRIWAYVKERDLQDPSDKRFIICDEPLKSVFHTDKVHMFTMNKILAKHFMDPADVVVPKGETESTGIKKDEPDVDYI